MGRLHFASLSNRHQVSHADFGYVRHRMSKLTLCAHLTAKIIKADHVVLYAQAVQEVKHSLGHHWRTTEVVLTILG